MPKRQKRRPIEQAVVDIIEKFATGFRSATMHGEIQAAVLAAVNQHVPPGTAIVAVTTRYQCPSCEAILDEGERRCEDCGKFGSKVVGFTCPECEEFVSEDKL